MKQSLQIKMGQSLAMTPQLQQAIKLLQLSTLELQTEIQTALESNPMLEMQDDEGTEPREADLANESRETRDANQEAETAAAEQKQSASELELVGKARRTSKTSYPRTCPSIAPGMTSTTQRLPPAPAYPAATANQGFHRISQRRHCQHSGSSQRADPVRAIIRA